MALRCALILVLVAGQAAAGPARGEAVRLELKSGLFVEGTLLAETERGYLVRTPKGTQLIPFTDLAVPRAERPSSPAPASPSPASPAPATPAPATFNRGDPVRFVLIDGSVVEGTLVAEMTTGYLVRTNDGSRLVRREQIAPAAPAPPRKPESVPFAPPRAPVVEQPRAPVAEQPRSPVREAPPPLPLRAKPLELPAPPSEPESTRPDSRRGTDLPTPSDLTEPVVKPEPVDAARVGLGLHPEYVWGSDARRLTQSARCRPCASGYTYDAGGAARLSLIIDVPLSKSLWSRFLVTGGISLVNGYGGTTTPDGRFPTTGVRISVPVDLEASIFLRLGRVFSLGVGVAGAIIIPLDANFPVLPVLFQVTPRVYPALFHLGENNTLGLSAGLSWDSGSFQTISSTTQVDRQFFRLGVHYGHTF